MYFAGVVIGDNQILPNLSAMVLASILSLFINSKLDLSFTFFFRPQRLKYPVYTVAGGFVCAKKVWQTQEGTMNSPSLFLIQSRCIFLNFSSSHPPRPQKKKKPLARQPFVLVSLRVVISFSLAKYVIALWLVRFTIVLDYSMHCLH